MSRYVSNKEDAERILRRIESSEQSFATQPPDDSTKTNIHRVCLFRLSVTLLHLILFSQDIRPDYKHAETDTGSRTDLWMGQERGSGLDDRKFHRRDTRGRLRISSTVSNAFLEARKFMSLLLRHPCNRLYLTVIVN